MAVLRQGAVISATVEQSLGNCLLISFKHRSRTFRGVLFDERNSVVPRTTSNKQNNEHNLMVNKSSLPLGTAIVSPSKQPYSSLRNRIYYNTNAKRSGSSNSRTNGSRSSESRSASTSKLQNDMPVSMGKDSVNCSSSSQSQKKMGMEDEIGLENRHSSRLLRQRPINPSENGTSMKRKADFELVGSKPPKSRSHVLASSSSVVSHNTKRNGSRSHRKATSSTSNSTKVDTISSDLNNGAIQSENIEKSECDEVEPSNTFNNDNGSDCGTPTSVRHNLFPPDHTNDESNVFSNDQADSQSISNEENQCIVEENDSVTEFFGSLGIGRTKSVDKDDASIFTDSGASSSSSEQLFEQQERTEERKDDLYHENEFDSNNGDIFEKEETENKLTPLTPAKKSARISAKRAILEQNMDAFKGETTIWSIWGGLPTQKENKIKLSSSEGLPDETQINSQENKSDCVNMSPDPLSSSELSLPPEMDKPQGTPIKVKGPRIKQTPVRVKKIIASPAIQPEKQVSVGNIVWGKVHGHPWWPGRVLAVSGNIGEGNEVIQHAHVTWFGSNTSSIMPVNELQHFVANFRRRHKKAKRGCYRKAVKQAQEMLQIMGEI